MTVVLAVGLCPAPSFADVPTAQNRISTAQSTSVSTPTQAQIQDFLNAHPFSENSAVTYAENPNTTSPYTAGDLSNATKQQALNALNCIRYIAGLDADVAIDAAYGEKAQAGALVTAVNGKLEHTNPAQPTGMSDALYQLGKSGTSKSNLAAGFANPITALMGYMDDSDEGNYRVVGHRRWLMNPQMGKTGFGQVGAYNATYAIDFSNSTATNANIAWPAQNMPTFLFGADEMWSLSYDSDSLGDVSSVELVRNNDKKMWDFSSSSGDGEFFVSNTSYGGLPAVVFCPSGIEKYSAGDSFTVTVVGSKSSYTYPVTFFDAYTADTPVKGDAFNDGVLQYKVTSYAQGSGTVTVTGCEYYATSAVIPATVKKDGATYKVTAIANDAMNGRSQLKTVVVGGNVQSIGKRAFAGCTALKTVKLSTSKLTTIGKKAFYGDKSLKKITITSTKLKTVGSKAFAETYAKAKVSVPKAKIAKYGKLLYKAGLSNKAAIKKI